MLSAEILRSRLSYNKDTGVFLWRPNKNGSRGWSARHAGKQAGTTDSRGYKKVVIDGEQYLLHRLAWLYVYGDWPDSHIDHINGNKSDNRICNLRDVDPVDNSRNAKRYSSNTSGVTGVSWISTRSRWKAAIKVGGKLVHLGYFHSLNEAAIARYEAEMRYGFHENHGRAS